MLASLGAVFTLGGCAQPDVESDPSNANYADMRTSERAVLHPLQYDDGVDRNKAPRSSADEPQSDTQSDMQPDVRSANDDSPIVPACACNKRFQQTGIASWYGKMFHGRRTASGERYDMHALTAAHRTLPLGACVRVTTLGRARSVVVRINDRGPFVHGRIIDLSYAAAEALGVRVAGSLPVKLEPIAPTHDAAGARRCLDQSA
ncbi:septal ring lytic transglycosylase RlpA family lipoprotein [Paraburkholderia rhynchosiae]|nr:septal ring lytic transglycosylase RlpA family lipoprotein [Paraburkholderia rhynchosiae]